MNLNLGLRAYFPFSGNANDASGNNNNAVFNNTTLTVDRLGNANSAYHFNGTSTYIQIPNSPTINTANKLSLCVWVRPMGYYTGPCHGNSVMMKGDNDYQTGNYLLRFDDAGYSNNTNCSSPLDLVHQNFYGNDVITPVPGYTPYIQSGQWYSVVLTCDGTTAKLYVNCELKFSKPQLATSFTNGYDLFLGTMNNIQYPYWFNGDLDEVRIYDRAINQDEVNVLGDCSTAACNNWLEVLTQDSKVAAGDLDISGNQLTIEASYNRTQPLNSGIYGGHLVSKHTGPADDNYSLFPNGCAITTTTGYFEAFETCPFELNKTNHVALVYDGINLKYYRNGFLMGRTPCTGNLINNDILTTIADYAGTHTPDDQFLGYVNEVRIWNVARTQTQLQAFMNSSLPNPATQAGLQGYYIFDDLLNKQGNATYNGTVIGTAIVNSANPNCNFSADSCRVTAGISGIINDYTPVLGFLPCYNKITVEDGTAFNAGDTVLMIQMKGAVIDTSNTPAFGTIIDYKNSGNYEYNYVKSRVGNVIELKNKLTRQYDIPAGKVQLIRVPYYTNASVTATLTSLPWDGNKGGVLVFNVKDSILLNADINVSGKGFRGGNTYNVGNAVLNCFRDEYYLDSASLASSRKGEGITGVGPGKLNGRGPLANGGGGGNGHNSGGAGGSNIAIGGLGGYQLYECNSSIHDNRGLPGIPLTYNNTANKIYLGGGGGAGHKDGQPTQEFSSAGGNGGGIVLITSTYLKSNTNSIVSNGNHGWQCDVDGFTCLHDGMGGGGAAGTVLLNITNYIDNHKENVIGGKGADLTLFTLAAGHVAPGGGGGGGIVWFKSASLPANATVTNTGGINGTIVLDSNNPFGSEPGQNGSDLFNLILPPDGPIFKPNIDSVRMKDSSITCLAFDFKGFGYTNTNPLASWQWFFGDGGTANTQNTTHNYTATGTFPVKLIVTDINGCIDSIIKNVTTNTISVDAGNDSTFCNTPVSLQLHGNIIGTGTYTWSPTAYLNNNTIPSPTATISSTTTFYLTATTASGCSVKDSVILNLKTASSLVRPPNKSFCSKETVQLDGGNGNTVLYLWAPPTWLNNSTIIDPIADPPASTSYSVTITDTTCNFDSTFTVLVTERALPVIKASRSNDIDCAFKNARLTATGGIQYLWQPAGTLSSSNISNPVATPTANTLYIVTGTDNNGCKNKDSVTVSVKDGINAYDIPNSFTPNGDRLNECFGIKHWGDAQNAIFIIYSRWGEKVFETNNVNNCWDGTFKGQPAEVGNYVYYVRARTACGDLEKKGNVLLIR